MKEYLDVIVGINNDYNRFFARETCSIIANRVSSTGIFDFQFCLEMAP